MVIFDTVPVTCHAIAANINSWDQNKPDTKWNEIVWILYIEMINEEMKCENNKKMCFKFENLFIWVDDFHKFLLEMPVQSHICGINSIAFRGIFGYSIMKQTNRGKIDENNPLYCSCSQSTPFHFIHTFHHINTMSITINMLWFPSLYFHSTTAHWVLLSNEAKKYVSWC